jgi:hypothetical protein
MNATNLIASTALAALIATTAAQAATITVDQACVPKGCAAIHIDGDIKMDDFSKFEIAITKNNIKTALVYLNSDGGSLLSGLIIGSKIYDHKFHTYVGADAHCVSVCASIWLGGAERYFDPTAGIGFHQPYTLDQKGQPHVDPRGIALVKAYYSKIGMSKPAADFFLAADPKDVYWLNGNLAAGFGIAAQEWEIKEEEPKPAEAAKPAEPKEEPKPTALDIRPTTKAVKPTFPLRSVFPGLFAP